jgi:O-antigen/teichoic acid export membrane protein
MRSAKKTSIISYLTVAFYLVTGFLYTPLLIKTLGVSDYAIYGLTATLVGYFSLDFGIGTAQTRYIAKLLAEGNRAKIKDLLGITTKLFTAIDIVIVLLLIIVYFFLEDIFTGLTVEEFARFKEVFVVTAVFIMINVPMLPVNGILIGFDRAYDLSIINALYRLISMSFLFVALWINLGLFWIVVINVGCQALNQIIKYFYIHKIENLTVNIKAKDKVLLKYLANFSLWSTIGLLADKFFFGIIPFLLAIVSNSHEIAIFAIVISLEGYTLTISKSLNGVFLPRIAKMVVNKQSPEEVTKLMTKVGRIQLYIVGLIIFGVICFGQEFLRLWLGEGFEKSYYCLILVLLPCLFHLTQTIGEETLLATNNVKYRALTNIVGSILSVSTILVLGPSFGALAAALGVFLSFTVAHNVIIDYFYSKRLKISMGYFLRNCHLKILPVFIVLTVCGLTCQHFLSDNTLVGFVTRGSLWAISVIICLWIFAFNKDEKSMIKSMIKRK